MEPLSSVCLPVTDVLWLSTGLGHKRKFLPCVEALCVQNFGDAVLVKHFQIWG